VTPTIDPEARRSVELLRAFLVFGRVFGSNPVKPVAGCAPSVRDSDELDAVRSKLVEEL
jgi:hypothetical protein